MIIFIAKKPNRIVKIGMDIEAAELQDWEVLLPNPASVDSGFLDSSANPNDFREIGADSHGIVHTNYFSLDTGESSMGSVPADFNVSEPASDNLSWIDPAGLEAGSLMKKPGESWPDSGSDRSDDQVFDGKGELGILQKDTIGGVFDRIEEIGSEIEQQFEGDANLKDMYAAEEEKHKGESLVGSEMQETAGKKSHEVEDKKKSDVVWWKAPFQLFKCYILKSIHVRRFSMAAAAAAALGFAILGHRLYKMMMKRRMKVLEEGKTKVVSHFIGRATLYEAFSMAKQVPAMIRPQFPGPAAAVIPWPVIALI